MYCSIEIHDINELLFISKSNLPKQCGEKAVSSLLKETFSFPELILPPIPFAKDVSSQFVEYGLEGKRKLFYDKLHLFQIRELATIYALMENVDEESLRKYELIIVTNSEVIDRSKHGDIIQSIDEIELSFGYSLGNVLKSFDLPDIKYLNDTLVIDRKACC